MKRRAKEQKGIEYYMGLPYSILLHEVEEEGERYWIAEVSELPGCKSHGVNVEEAVKSVEEAKRDWILDSLKSEDEVPVPVEKDRYSGKMLVRMSRSLHRSLANIAEAEKLSLNQLIVTMLAKEAGHLSALNRVEDKVDNLLQKIDHAIEEEGVRIPFSKSIRVIGEPQEWEQHIISDQLADSPIAKAVDVIIEGAIKARASDIYIQPEGGGLRVRYLIDDTLQDTLNLPLATAVPIISRIKILAQMNIADRQGVQDGLFRVRVATTNQVIECKVGTTSTKFGETAILHLSQKTFSGVANDIEKQMSELSSKFA